MSGSPEGYGRHQRIIKTDDFSSVFRLRPVHQTEHFVLYLRPSSIGQARLGVVVAKRLAPRAVTRNLIKRLTREVFRKAGLDGVDCIVRLNRAPVSRQSSAASGALRMVLGAELQDLFTRKAALSP